MRTMTYVQPIGFIRDFFAGFVNQDFGVKSYLFGAIVIFCNLCLIFNSLVIGYPGVNYLTWLFLITSPLFFLLYGFGLYLENHCSKYQRISLILKTLSYWVAMALLFEFGITAIQYTPFPLIDHYLLRFDQLVGFHTLPILAWTKHHAWANWISVIAYSGLSLEMLSIPLLLAFFKDKKQLNSLFIYFLLTSLITFVIYYFLPSTDPSNVIASPYFSAFQKDTYIKYYEMINHLRITTGGGGLISFPSLHVLWAIMMTYPLRHRKTLFYPLIAFNSLVVLSTITLGWHFLADVLGSFLIASLCIYFAEKWSQKRMQKNTLESLLFINRIGQSTKNT